MVVKHFYLLGEAPSSSRPLDVDPSGTFNELQYLIAGHFAIVAPEGIAFQCQAPLTRVPDILSTTTSISITIDGRAARNVPGPKGIPYVGNYLEIYPDHLGNHQRLFEMFGPVFQTHNFGRIIYHTNNPALPSIAFSETGFFTKEINQSHPLYGIKNNDAGIFIGDTDTDAWRMAHRFFPPAFSPQAVRHYAPTIQSGVEQSMGVFDRLDDFPGPPDIHNTGDSPSLTQDSNRGWRRSHSQIPPRISRLMVTSSLRWSSGFVRSRASLTLSKAGGPVA